MIFLFLQWQEKIRELIHQRRGKLFHTIFRQREVIYQTWEGVFHPISKQREVIYQTWEGVFYLISKLREVIYQTWEGVFYLISKHREVIYQTREKVFYRICKDRKVINKTRESVFYLTPNTKMSYVCQTRLEGVFILYSKNKSLDWKRARRKEYFKLISWSQDVRWKILCGVLHLVLI